MRALLAVIVAALALAGVASAKHAPASGDLPLVRMTQGVCAGVWPGPVLCSPHAGVPRYVSVGGVL